MPYLYHVISSATSLLQLRGKIFGLFGKISLNFRCCGNSVHLIKHPVFCDSGTLFPMVTSFNVMFVNRLQKQHKIVWEVYNTFNVFMI